MNCGELIELIELIELNRLVEMIELNGLLGEPRAGHPVGAASRGSYVNNGTYFLKVRI
jgi:hypothetical protein